MFYFPPRPEKAVHRDLIKFYEGQGWIAQVKKNGTCSVADVSSEGVVDLWTRHGTRHKAWDPHPEVMGFLSGLRDSTIVFELLHSKTTDVKDTAYVFDVLRWCGRDLSGVTLDERLKIIGAVHPLSDKVIVAKTHVDCLTGLYDSLVAPEDEGIVLKNPKSVLRYPFKADSNSGWQVKCRRSTKNYSF